MSAVNWFTLGMDAALVVWAVSSLVGDPDARGWYWVIGLALFSAAWVLVAAAVGS